jgi:hypothetical protein
MGLSGGAFGQLVDEIMAQGHSEDQAARYAALIGDTPARGDDVKLIVMDGTREVAQLKWPKLFSGLD